MTSHSLSNSPRVALLGIGSEMPIAVFTYDAFQEQEFADNAHMSTQYGVQSTLSALSIRNVGKLQDTGAASLSFRMRAMTRY